MPFLRHRPSPAMLVALLALFTAMSGTAVAAVLVSSPDQLADRVVTEPKLATSSVHGRALAFNSVGSSQLVDRQVFDDDLRNPIYSAAVSADGTTSTARSNGVDLSETRKLGTIGHPFLAGLYTVGFQHDVRDCAVAATAGVRGTIATVNHNPSNPRTVTVALSRARLNSAKTFVEDAAVESAFSVIAQC